MPTKDALAAGQTQERLNLIAVWRDAKVFTDAERATLALTEQGTRLADSAGVDDETRDAARKHFDDEELAALVALIAPGVGAAWPLMTDVAASPVLNTSAEGTGDAAVVTADGPAAGSAAVGHRTRTDRCGPAARDRTAHRWRRLRRRGR